MRDLEKENERQKWYRKEGNFKQIQHKE